MIGAEEVRRASPRRGGGEGGRRGGVGDKNNLNAACVRVFCVCESDKKRVFFFCQSAAASSLGGNLQSNERRLIRVKIVV